MSKKISIVLLAIIIISACIGVIDAGAVGGLFTLRIYPNDNAIEVYWVSDDDVYPTVTLTTNDTSPIQSQFSEETGRTVRLAYPSTSDMVKISVKYDDETLFEKTVYVKNLPQISVTVNETHTKAFISFSNVKMPTEAKLYDGMQFHSNVMNSSGSTYLALMSEDAEPYALITYNDEIEVYYTSRKGSVGLKPTFSFNADYSNAHTTDPIYTLGGILINSTSLKINEYNIPLTENGYFEYAVHLNEGENIFEFLSENDDNIARFTAHIFLDTGTAAETSGEKDGGGKGKPIMLYGIAIVLVGSMGVWAIKKYLVKKKSE